MGRKKKPQSQPFAAPETGEWVDLPEGEWVDLPADEWDAPPETFSVREAPGLRGNVVAPTRNPVSRTSAALQGAAQGSTFGWGDEASAALGALAEEVLPIEGVSDRDASLADRYRRLRDSMRSDLEQARADQPGAYFGGELAGGAVTSAPLAMATGGTLGLPGMMGLGAAQGAISGAGHSTGGVQDTAWDALEGGVVGAALPVVGNALARAAAPAAAAASRGLTRAGYRAAAAGAGLDKTAARKMVARSPASTVDDAFEQYGRDLERLGVTQGQGALGLPPRFGEQAQRAGAVASQRGAQMGQIASQMTQAGVTVPVSVDVAEAAFAKMRPALRSAQPELRQAATDLRAAIAEARRNGSGSVALPFNSAWLTRQHVNRFRNPVSSAAEQAEFTAISEGVENAMRSAIEQADPAARRAWQSASRDYAITRPLQEAGEAREVGEQINQVMSLRNVTGGGAGASFGGAAGALLGGPAGAGVGSALGGALGFGATQALRGRGHQMTAAAYRALGESMQPLPSALTRAGERIATGGALMSSTAGAAPAEPPATRIKQRLQADPQSFGQYAPQLIEAMQSGDNVDLGALHFRLMATEPQYRALYERSEQ